MSKNKKILFLFALLFTVFLVEAQNSDTKYSRDLEDVLLDIEKQYQVDLSFAGSMVRGKMLDYANWRFRPTIEETLKNVLTPFDLVFEKQDDNTYRISHFRYSKITLREGVERLDYMKTLYEDQKSWEVRKAELKECMRAIFHFYDLPEWPDSDPIVTNKRKMKGYQVENIALEVLPGLYTTGSIYKPAKLKGKVPVILCPNGHFTNGRYNEDMQIRCAMLAQMGAIVMNYDLFAWGESLLQFEDHKQSTAQLVQVLSSERILDYLLSLNHADPDRVAITGGSGGGSHTMLMSAIDERINVSVPVVMLSCYFYGGCPCESGQPIHLCGGGTNNVEIAAMFAPKPQLVISDGGDWSNHVPEYEFPFMQRTYGFYNQLDHVKNVHLPEEGHDYGRSKRIAMYDFMGEFLQLDTVRVKDKSGNYDESNSVIEDEAAMYVFSNDKANLPENAIHGIDELEKVLETSFGE